MLEGVSRRVEDFERDHGVRGELVVVGRVLQDLPGTVVRLGDDDRRFIGQYDRSPP